MSDPLQGSTLPQMTLDHSEGGELNIPGDLKGQWTLFYFYPKDDTPGCTKQACGYRDHVNEFQSLGLKVYGVSMDSLESHQQFKDKFSLNFPLLADVDGQLSTALGVYGDQEWGGKVFKGLSRDSFLVGPDGTIQHVWRKVDPTTTMAETYEKAQALMESAK